jgi:hypothetical protein
MMGAMRILLRDLRRLRRLQKGMALAQTETGATQAAVTDLGLMAALGTVPGLIVMKKPPVNRTLEGQHLRGGLKSLRHLPRRRHHLHSQRMTRMLTTTKTVRRITVKSSTKRLPAMTAMTARTILPRHYRP